MSQIAALLLMYLEREEDAFWGLHKLMVGNLYRMHGLFIPNFPKLIRYRTGHNRVIYKVQDTTQQGYIFFLLEMI